MRLLPTCVLFAVTVCVGCSSPEDTATIEREAFEKFADLAVVLPPVIRTGNLEAYSTNKLTFALN